MNCPHCSIPIGKHTSSDCMDLWILKDVFGWTTSVKPYEGDFYPKGSYFVIWHQPDDFMPGTLMLLSQAFDKEGNNLRSTKSNQFGVWDESPGYDYSLAFSTDMNAAWIVAIKASIKQVPVGEESALWICKEALIRRRS